jgi:hypothetical protein
MAGDSASFLAGDGGLRPVAALTGTQVHKRGGRGQNPASAELHRRFRARLEFLKTAVHDRYTRFALAALLERAFFQAEFKP